MGSGYPVESGRRPRQAELPDAQAQRPRIIPTEGGTRRPASPPSAIRLRHEQEVAERLGFGDFEAYYRDRRARGWTINEIAKEAGRDRQSRRTASSTSAPGPTRSCRWRPRCESRSRCRCSSRGLRRAQGVARPRVDRQVIGTVRTGAARRTALIAWLEASSGDSAITVAGRSKRARGSARRVPWP